MTTTSGYLRRTFLPTMFGLCSVLSGACTSAANVGAPTNGAPPAPAPPDATTSAADAPRDWSGAWEWLAPQATTATLRAGWAAAPDDVWLVGDQGTVLRWDGKARARVAFQGPPTATYRAVAGSSADDVWVCGDHAAAHWNGVSWSTSLLLDGYDCRALVAVGNGLFAAVTADRRVLSVSEAGSMVTRASNVLDLVRANDGALYALTPDGVKRLSEAFQISDVVTFTNSLLTDGAAKSKILEGRLVGTDPASFGFFFSYTYASASGTGVKALYVPSATQSGGGLSFGPLFAAGDEAFAAHVGGDLLVSLGRFDEVWLVGAEGARRASDGARRARGGMLLPSGPIALGTEGFFAGITPHPTSPSEMHVTPLVKKDAVARLFVAPDGAAFASGSATFGNRTYANQLGTWSDEAGWTFRPIPATATVAPHVIGAAAGSASAAWLAVRRAETGGADVLVHWNGASFDRELPLGRPLWNLESDRDGGFFALDEDGTLHHGGDDGMVALGHAGRPVTDEGLVLCTSVIAPLSASKVWVLDRSCVLRLWDGSAMVTKPSPRTAAHASGWADFGMWAVSDASVWLADPWVGLRHFDGTTWKDVHYTDRGIRAVYAVDDEHVWFTDDLLRVWDGTLARPIGAAPTATHFAGAKESLWLGGGAALLRLDAAHRAEVR